MCFFIENEIFSNNSLCKYYHMTDGYSSLKTVLNVLTWILINVISLYVIFSIHQIVYCLSIKKIFYLNIYLLWNKNWSETDVIEQKSIIALNAVEVPLITFTKLIKNFRFQQCDWNYFMHFQILLLIKCLWILFRN